MTNIYREVYREPEPLDVDSFVEQTLPDNIESDSFVVPESMKNEVVKMVNALIDEIKITNAWGGNINNWIVDLLQKIKYKHQALSVIGDEDMNISPEEINEFLKNEKLSLPQIGFSAEEDASAIGTKTTIIAAISLMIMNMIYASNFEVNTSTRLELMIVNSLICILCGSLAKRMSKIMEMRDVALKVNEKDYLSVLATIAHYHKRMQSADASEAEKYRCMRKIKTYLELLNQNKQGQEDIIVTQWGIRTSLKATLDSHNGSRRKSNAEKTHIEPSTARIDIGEDDSREAVQRREALAALEYLEAEEQECMGREKAALSCQKA